MLRRLPSVARQASWELNSLIHPLSTDATSDPPTESENSTAVVAVTKKKRVVFDSTRFRQPNAVEAQPATFPYLYEDPEEDYYRRRFYPSLKEDSDESDEEKGLGGWRRRGTKENYGRSFRESRLTRDSFIARYGVEALKPATKHRPFWETQDPGDLDDEKYFDEREHIYAPIKPRLKKDIPKTMGSLVQSLSRFAREGNHFLAAEILDEGAECTRFDQTLWTPLHYACDRGHYQMVKLFLMKQPDVNIQDYDGVSALMVAAQGGDERICQLLIDDGANLELHDKLGRTALLLALAGGHHRVPSLLIDSSANVQARDKDGWTAWHFVCFYNCLPMGPILLETPANINQQDLEGNTALHLGASCGSHELCSLLVKHGANRHIKNHEGDTPAHVAVQWVHIQCLAALLRSPEDDAQLNAQGETPREVAQRMGHRRVLDVWEKRVDPVDGESPSNDVTAVSSADPAVTLNVVTIRVSGRTFVTSKSTLEVIYGSYFWMMLNPGEGDPILEDPTQLELGPGPGKELKRVSEMEFEIERDANLFGQILDLLRSLKYSTLEDVELPDDKYELGMLLDEAKFFRLTKIVEALKAHRRTRQAKSYRNVLTEKRRKKLVSIGLSPPLVTDYGRSYQPPSVERPHGNEQYRQWDPITDPFAKKLPNLPKTLPKRRKPR